jgi:protein CpxP
MKKIGKQLGKKLAFGFIAFGFVSASELVSAQEQASRHCQVQSRIAESVQANLAKNQEQLLAELQLSANQEPAWNDFVNSLPATQVTSAKSLRQERITMDKLSTPERLEQQLNLLKEQEAKMSANLMALKTFYAALTPEQQKAFDEYHAKMARSTPS